MAVKTYYLETEIINGTERVKGIDYIHHAILEIEGTKRKLIMDTTADEDSALSALALEVREPTAEELDAFNALKPKR